MRQKTVRAACIVGIADRLQLDRNSKKKGSSKVKFIMLQKKLKKFYMYVCLV